MNEVESYETIVWRNGKVQIPRFEQEACFCLARNRLFAGATPLQLFQLANARW